MEEPMEILNEPLMTTKGYLNPACMNELGAAIRNMPPDHERLGGDPEWSAKRLTAIKDITGGLAKWAVMQSPYAAPKFLESVIGYVDACLQVMFGKHEFLELSLCDIVRILHEFLMDGDGIPEFVAWNKPKDGNRDEVKFVCRESKSDSDSDFIDLDALLRNVCLDIRMERRAFDAFNREFDRRHEGASEEK